MPIPKEFRPAPPEIIAIVNRHIAAHFPQLATARLVVAVRESAADAGEGKATVAATGVPANAAEAAQFEYFTWFAWDVWQMLDERAREAIVFHELTHCDRDEAGRPILKDHDAQVFNKEVELYGVWWQSAQKTFAART